MRESLKWIVIYIWYHLGLNSVLHFGQTYVFDTIITYKTINKTNTGTAIKYQGTSKWLPNQFTWQDESIRVEISKNKEINTFFIIAPPFWFYYSTHCGWVQYENAFRHSEKIHFLFSLISSPEKSRGRLREKWRVKREKWRVQKEKAACATFLFGCGGGIWKAHSKT